MTLFPQKRQALYLSVAKLIHRRKSSLADVLQELAEVEDNWLYSAVISRLANAVRAGMSMSDALSKESLYFPKREVDLVRIGETAEKLPETLELLGNVDYSGSIRLWITWGLIIGCLLHVFGAISLLLVFSVSRYTVMYNEMLAGEPLPALTRWVIAMSSILRNHFVSLILFCSVLFGGFAFFKRINPWFLHDRSPKILPASRDYPLERDCMFLCQRLSIMTLCGHSIEDSLNASLNDASTHALRYHLRQWIADVQKGESLAVSISRKPVKRGPLRLLQNGLSRIPENAPTASLIDLTQAFVSRATIVSPLVQGEIFPILFAFSAFIIGAIVIAMFMPLIKLIERLG